jgi:hypothetical protein
VGFGEVDDGVWAERGLMQVRSDLEFGRRQGELDGPRAGTLSYLIGR